MANGYDFSNWAAMTPDQQNAMLLDIGKQGSYTDDQLKQLAGLGTSALITGDTSGLFGNGGFLGTGIGALGSSTEGWSDLLKGTDWLGVGKLGLGALSYLDQSKTSDKQRDLMDQQIAQNRYVLDTAKARNKDISATFGGNGLAASSVG